jgi:hypothetical protein
VEVEMANLYVFHMRQESDQQLWYTVFDGTNWAPDTQVPNLGVSFSPSAVAWNGGIAVFHQGQDADQQLWYTLSPDGTNWAPDTQISNPGGVARMTDSPSAVVIENVYLFAFHQGQQADQQLWYSVWSLGHDQWVQDRQVPNLGMSGSPSAVAWAGGITVFHAGQMNDG